MTNQTNTGALQGQVAVVTGGGRGIGREIARQLAAAGARVVVTARTATQLEETCRMITAAGGHCTAQIMDVGDDSSVNAAFQAIMQAHGAVDLLVNNAGISGEAGLPWDQKTADWWRTLEVNLKGPYLCAKTVIPGMIAQKRGRIIMVSSNLAFFPMPEFSAYSCSKAGLIRLTDNLAAGLKEHGLAVFAISPGLVKTEMTIDGPIKPAPNAQWTPVEKAAELCVALATGRADALTGRFIHAATHNLNDLIARAGEIAAKNLQTMRLAE